MNITAANFTETGSINVTIDGVVHTVPDDLTNRHRQRLAEWEAEGNIIAPYVPPPPPTAAELAAMDEGELNRVLIAPGSVVRALAEIVFGVSKGTIAIDPARTKAQFIGLLKARMR